jgi:hypothetical protein
MKLTLTVISVLAALVLFSCRQKEEQSQEQQAQPQQQAQSQQQAQPQTQSPQQSDAVMHTGVVQQVLQATAYTYLNVKENDATYWIAVTKRDLKPGATISFAGGLEMDNFQSKDLDRTFDKVYFVSRLAGDMPAPPADQSSAGMAHGMIPQIEKKTLSIQPAKGGITIGELYANRKTYAGKTVLIKGQVTKVNRATMGKNWVHLQDGTSDANSYDLTVTTTDDANVGDVATFEGKITLNKDFGAGYSYAVIMEDASKKTQ